MIFSKSFLTFSADKFLDLRRCPAKYYAVLVGFLHRNQAQCCQEDISVLLPFRTRVTPRCCIYFLSILVPSSGLLKNRVAIVTGSDAFAKFGFNGVIAGGSSGIGHAIAKIFALEGARVAGALRLVNAPHRQQNKQTRSVLSRELNRATAAAKAIEAKAKSKLGDQGVVTSSLGFTVCAQFACWAFSATCRTAALWPRRWTTSPGSWAVLPYSSTPLVRCCCATLLLCCCVCFVVDFNVVLVGVRLLVLCVFVVCVQESITMRC